ncbi:MAG: ABC transporter permease [Cyclobacteriaceae bacterium]|nr:ABC transporter permease [Cyclobacteriaceae bacterium]
MISNYFKVAIRNILKYKFFSAINILGMTIGLTSCLMVMLYVTNELSYDNFHPSAERIYQVGLHGRMGGQDLMVATTCPPMAAALVADLPEVEASTRIASAFGQPVVKVGEKIFTEEKLFYVDSNFFDFFGYKLRSGDVTTALKEPGTVLLTPPMVEKYFGNENPLGQLMVIGNDNKTFKVTGVVEEAPANSHFTYKMLISAQSSERLKSTIWLNNNMYTYIRLRPGALASSVDSKFDGIVEKYVGPEVEKFMGTSLAQMKASGGAFGYFTTPLLDLHLHSKTQGDLEPAGSMLYVYFFAGIGIFIVLIASINFMNLSTARSAGRAKEVGLRKTLGSLRAQMIAQFLSESMLYTFTAMLLALVAAWLLMPYFNLLSGKNLEPSSLFEPLFILGLLGMALVVGLVAGSYPAFYLTSFSPVEVLKGKVRAGMKSKGIRSTLVVMQFLLSIFLIIFTAVIYQQITYMQEKNMGIDKNNVLVLENMGRLGTNKESFRNALREQTGVVNVSYTNNSFPGVNNTTVVREIEGSKDHIMGVYYADYEHQDVMKFEMKEGRYFSREFPSDSLAAVLNESAVREFGFKDPLNEEIEYNDEGDTFKRYKVIGVVKNFNFESFRDQVRPVAIFLTRNANNLLVRYEGSSQDIVAKTEKLWKEYSTREPLDYAFMDDSFDRLFRTEQRMGQIFTVFSGLAILVACLGLFALAAFTAEQRTKEIGIRKALGASSTRLTVLLSLEFTWLVLIAFLPASLLGWWVSDQWLSGFVYRINISPLIFFGSGLAAIAIAWLTVSFQAMKAAAVNPVKSLRYE